MPDTRRCGNCKSFKEWQNSDLGQCHRHPPIALDKGEILAADDVADNRWPLCLKHEVCDDHKFPAEDPVGDLDEWITGATIPSELLGNDGDLYLNTTNGDVYEKVNGTWF